MNNRILTFIRTELPWILVAVGLSFFLWMVSMTLLDPEQNESYMRPLIPFNETVLITEGVVLLNPEDLPDEITVGVRAPASLHGLDAESEITTHIDFRAVTRQMVHEADAPIELTLPVGVNVPEGFVVHRISPPAVTLLFDAFVRAPFAVTVLESGAVVPGAVVQRIWTANTNVTISGPRSVINEIAGVYVLAELNGLSESITSTQEILVVNADAHDLSHLLELSISETTLNIEILPMVRVDIIPQITGTLAAGFAVSEYFTDPAYVYIVGAVERLIEVPYLSPVFALEQANRDFEIVFDLTDSLPDGVQLLYGTPAGAHLHVIVEPIQERTFHILRGNVGVFGGANYTILGDPSHVSVRVAGPASRITAMASADINVALNLGGRAVGTHNVPLQIQLPPGMGIVGAQPAWDVRIDSPNAQNNGNNGTEPPPPPDPTDPFEPSPYDPDPPVEPATEPPTDPPVYPYPPEYPDPYPPYDYPPYGEPPYGNGDEDYYPGG
ncbi:MAG: CdaR family protein [Defluviitaleaceae bacterium]|nr:CdaR family protein [Defluviitaleaceae bacterium]